MDLVRLRYGNVAPQAYRTNVTDGGRVLPTSYLTLMRPSTGQRVHDPREVFDALRWIVRAAALWWTLPNDFLSQETICQQILQWSED